MALLAGAGAQEVPRELPFNDTTTVVFATAEQSRAILTREDEFVQQLSPMDLRLRLGTNEAVTVQEFLRFVAQQVLEWSPQEMQQIASSIVRIREAVADIQPLWPEKIYLVKTTGREESQAPHTRGASIVIPQSLLRAEPRSLERVLLHELFHVLSRHAVDRRPQLYGIIGFATTDDIRLPDGYRDRKLTNPDAPRVDVVARVEQQGQTIHVAPILYSRSESDTSVDGKTVFGELVFRLMEVTGSANEWAPRLDDGQPRLWQLNELPGLLKQIGGNTRYVLHPEEILADNFVHLVRKTDSLPDPWIIERLGEQLLKPASPQD